MAGRRRFIAERINGDGSGEFIHWNLPLTNPQITPDVLSGPPQLTATIDQADESLLSGSKPILEAGNTAIYYEVDGVIGGGWLLAEPEVEDQEFRIDGSGFCGYPGSVDYTGEYSKFGVDPLDVVRDMWAYLQSFPNGKLGMVLDQTKSTVRLGTRGNGKTDDTKTEDDPFEINWFTPDNVGKRIEELAKETPFQYREEHAWNADHTAINHYLRLGHPTLGRRRTDLRFVLGENVDIPPQVTLGGGYANEVTVIGSGEGRKMIRATASTQDGRVRKAVTITDKKINTKSKAETRARTELQARQPFNDIVQVIVRNTPGTPIGSWKAGDQIRIVAKGDWLYIDQWVTVISTATTPFGKDEAVVTVIKP